MAESIYNIIKKASSATNEMFPEREMLDIFYNEFVDQNRVFDLNYKPDFDLRQFWLDLNKSIIESYSLKEDQVVAITALFKKYYVPISNEFLNKILELKHIYFSYLASEYCNGRNNNTIEYLLKNNNVEFIKEVHFQQNLKIAVVVREQEKLKRKLSSLDKQATFEIADNEITSAFELIQKKNEHDPIKRKMLEWDKNEQNINNGSNVIPIQNTPRREKGIAKHERRKIIPLSFIKYAAAACFVGVMVWIGIKFYNNQPKENILAKNKSDSLKTIQVKPEFAKVEMTQYVLPIVKEIGLGFGKTGKIGTINIAIQDVAPRIISIEAFLNTPEKDTSERTLRKNATEELASLKKLSASYIFDGITLQLFRTLDAHVQNTIIKTGNKKYYFKAGSSFYYLINTNKQEEFKKVADKAIIDKLERIVFDNEK